MSESLAVYGRILRSRWRWLVMGVLLALAATTIFLIVSPPLYRSEATVFVRTPGDVSQVQDGGDSYAQGRAQTYTALANNTAVAARVIADLGLDGDAGGVVRSHFRQPPHRYRAHPHRAQRTDGTEAERPLAYCCRSTPLTSELSSRCRAPWFPAPSSSSSILQDHPTESWPGACQFQSCCSQPRCSVW